MGLYDNLLDIHNALRNDEDLLRLLYYPPENLSKGIPDPLDSSLGNVLDKPKDELKQIRNERILRTPKDSDLNDKKICRLYFYAGKRRGQRGNYLMADQSLIIDILCHINFEEGDLRLARIGDRVNQLLVHSRVTGIGKIEYLDGDPIKAPNNYLGYRHIYEFGGTKK